MLHLAATRPLAGLFADDGQGSPLSDGIPVSDDDKVYFQRRAEAEIALAQASDNEHAVRSHYLMAGYYLDLVHHERPVEEG